jgi:hypothetical protein
MYCEAEVLSNTYLQFILINRLGIKALVECLIASSIIISSRCVCSSIILSISMYVVQLSIVGIRFRGVLVLVLYNYFY